MQVAEYAGQLEADGRRLAEVAAGTDLGAPVPTCPEWELRDLVHHVGGVHRWASAFVRGEAGMPEEGDLELIVGGWPPEDGLVEWFRTGHRELVGALRAAPADLDAWTFLEAPTPLVFWARRQAHETAIHRVDAESAAGDITGFPAPFAADGIDELIRAFANRPGRAFDVEGDRSIAIRAEDADRAWTITFTSEGFRNHEGDTEGADLELAGGASDLFQVLWNRRGPDDLTVRGDPALLDRWSEAVRIRWS
jgi:uncharacterized protein (TIGR03083 family)